MSTITVKFFGQLREHMARDAIVIEASGIDTIDDIILSISAQEESFQMVSELNWLCAVNHEIVDRFHVVKAGDEVAFFPPVTGG